MVWEETLRSDCCWDSGQETRRNERRTADEVVEIAGNGGERLTGIPVFLLFVSFFTSVTVVFPHYHFHFFFQLFLSLSSYSTYAVSRSLYSLNSCSVR